MLSNDINANEFVRKDVYEADQRALMAEIKLGNAEILKRFDQIAAELHGRIDKLETKIEVIDYRLDALEGRVGDIQTYGAWGIAFIGIIVAVAVVALPVSEFFRKVFKPSINIDDIRAIVATEVEQILNARLETNRGV